MVDIDELSILVEELRDVKNLIDDITFPGFIIDVSPSLVQLKFDAESYRHRPTKRIPMIITNSKMTINASV